MPDWRTHPDEGDLIRYCDGELRAKETERLARHLEACWDCRTRLDDLKQTIAEYVRYRRVILEPSLPQPPLPWKDLHAEFTRLPAPRRIFPRRAVWLIAAAAAAGTGIMLYRSNEPRHTAPAAIVQPLAQHPVIAAPPPSVARPPRKLSPGPEDELRVIAALDHIGAGLGDPIEVVRTPDHIVVTCMGLSAERMREVRAAVSALPGVSVETSPKPAAASAGSPLEVVGAPRAGDDPQLADEILKSSEAMMARAHALRGLAARFPPEVEAPMSAGAKTLLGAIRADHEAALAREVAAIAKVVQPLAPGPAAPTGEPWQTRTLRLFSEAEQVDHLLGTIFAGNHAENANDRPALAAALSKLQSDVESR